MISYLLGDDIHGFYGAVLEPHGGYWLYATETGILARHLTYFNSYDQAKFLLNQIEDLTTK